MKINISNPFHVTLVDRNCSRVHENFFGWKVVCFPKKLRSNRFLHLQRYIQRYNVMHILDYTRSGCVNGVTLCLKHWNYYISYIFKWICMLFLAWCRTVGTRYICRSPQVYKHCFKFEILTYTYLNVKNHYVSLDLKSSPKNEWA